MEKGADVDAQEPNGWSALMFTSMLNDLLTIENLILAGANVNIKTNEGETSLKRAEALEYPELIKILKAAGAK